MENHDISEVRENPIVTYNVVAYCFGAVLMAIIIFLLTVGYSTVNGKLDRSEYLKDYQRRNEDVASIKAEQQNINIKLDAIYSKLDGIPDLKKMMEKHLLERR